MSDVGPQSVGGIWSADKLAIAIIVLAAVVALSLMGFFFEVPSSMQPHLQELRGALILVLGIIVRDRFHGG